MNHSGIDLGKRESQLDATPTAYDWQRRDGAARAVANIVAKLRVEAPLVQCPPF
jgi:hypothetical protein